MLKPPLTPAVGVLTAPKLDFPNTEPLDCPKPDWPNADWPNAPGGFISNPLFPKADEGFGVSGEVGLSLGGTLPNTLDCELRLANAPKPVAGLIALKPPELLPALA